MPYATIGFPLLRVFNLFCVLIFFRWNALLIYICKLYFHCLLLGCKYSQQDCHLVAVQDGEGRNKKQASLYYYHFYQWKLDCTTWFKHVMQMTSCIESQNLADSVFSAQALNQLLLSTSMNSPQRCHHIPPASISLAPLIPFFLFISCLGTYSSWDVSEPRLRGSPLQANYIHVLI